MQLWIRSAEPPGEHHYENRNNKRPSAFMIILGQFPFISQKREARQTIIFMFLSQAKVDLGASPMSSFCLRKNLGKNDKNLDILRHLNRLGLNVVRYPNSYH